MVSVPCTRPLGLFTRALTQGGFTRIATPNSPQATSGLWLAKDVETLSSKQRIREMDPGAQPSPFSPLDAFSPPAFSGVPATDPAEFSALFDCLHTPEHGQAVDGAFKAMPVSRPASRIASSLLTTPILASPVSPAQTQCHSEMHRIAASPFSLFSLAPEATVLQGTRPPTPPSQPDLHPKRLERRSSLEFGLSIPLRPATPEEITDLVAAAELLSASFSDSLASSLSSHDSSDSSKSKAKRSHPCTFPGCDKVVYVDLVVLEWMI